jgi:hypothetical protein
MMTMKIQSAVKARDNTMQISMTFKSSPPFPLKKIWFTITDDRP